MFRNFVFDLQLFADINLDNEPICESIEITVKAGEKINITGTKMKKGDIHSYVAAENGTLQFVRSANNGYDAGLYNGKVILAASSSSEGNSAFLIKPADDFMPVESSWPAWNHAKCNIVLEAYNGQVNSAVWQGKPGAGGYFEYRMSAMGAPVTWRYQSLNEEGTIIKEVNTYTGETGPVQKVRYADLRNGNLNSNNGLLGLEGLLKEKSTFSQSVQDEISRLEASMPTIPTTPDKPVVEVDDGLTVKWPGTGKKVTTKALKAGDVVTVDCDDDITSYTAGADGKLVFVGEEDVEDGQTYKGMALYSGTVKLEAGTGKLLSTGSKLADPDDDYGVINQSDDDILVKVANGVIASITGLKKKNGGSVIVVGSLLKEEEGKETYTATRYSLVGDRDHTMVKKENGVYVFSQNNEQFTVTDPKKSSYVLYKEGSNIHTAAYQVGQLAKMGGLELSQKGTTSINYSRGENGLVEITEKAITDNKQNGQHDNSLNVEVVTDGDDKYFKPAYTEAYLRVTATTDKNLVSTLKVESLRAKADGSFYVDTKENGWSGALSISGMKNKEAADYTDKYAVLKYSKPKAYANVEHEGNMHNVLKVTDAALGSVFTGYGQYDTIETAATGDQAVNLTTGSYNIYHTVKNADGTNTVELRSLSVTGQADIKTKDGQVASLSNLSGKNAKVTLTEGKVSTVYELKGDSYWKTETVNGKKVSHKIAAAGVTNILSVKAEDWSLASGTATLAGNESLKAGGATVTAQGSSITVTASGDKYTIGGITDGAEFKAGEQTFHRYGSLLFTTHEGKLMQTVATGKASTLASAALDKFADTKVWKHAVVADSQYITETVNLSLVDNAVKAIEKKNADAVKFNDNPKNTKKLKKETQSLPTTMSFIHDKYVVEGTKKAARSTTVVTGESYDTTYQQAAGTATLETRTYDASAAIAGQNITVTEGWTVKAGQHDDTITGATKGSDTINAGAGKNTIKLGGAADTVIVGTEDSQDTITGYASGKDKIKTLADGFHYLVKGADLYLTNAEETLNSVEGHQHALLKGAAVSTKAVNINGENYYFGGVKVNVDKKTKEVTATNTQSNTFNYDANDDTAHYIGNTETTATGYLSNKSKNPSLDTLKVAETADKDSYVTIDLLEKGTADKDKHYVSIDEVNASGMKAAKGVKVNEYVDYKGVNVTASDTGLRFTGSKFADTVTCGKGKNYIITSLNQGKDTVNNFSVGDIIQINGLNAKTIAKLKNEGELDGNGYLIKNDTLTLGTGSITVNHAAGVQLQVSGNTIQAVNNVK